jgi:hypothetical protein
MRPASAAGSTREGRRQKGGFAGKALAPITPQGLARVLTQMGQHVAATRIRSSTEAIKGLGAEFAASPSPRCEASRSAGGRWHRFRIRSLLCLRPKPLFEDELIRDEVPHANG